jgi:hypothetical protein
MKKRCDQRGMALILFFDLCLQPSTAFAFRAV